MRSRPYIGINGVMKPQEVTEAIRHFDAPHGRSLMVGTVATYKSLRGIPMKEYWAQQTPSLERVQEIFLAGAGRGALNLVHYSADASDRRWFCKDMLEIVSTIGDSLDGFQLNMVWPSWQFLSAFHTLTPGRRRHIVLQIGNAAVAQVGGRPSMLVRILKSYVDLVDHVLLDASGGQGKPLNTAWALQYLRAMRDAGLPFELGVAGGLGPYTMGPIKELIHEFPNLSWDAQRLLRNAENELDPDFVNRYLEESCAILR